MPDADALSLDEVIANYLEALDSGIAVDPHRFIEPWPHYKNDFFRFLRHNESVQGSINDEVLTTTDGDADARRLVRALEAIGEYEIGPSLGRGGMGLIYAARRVSDNLPVALKVLHLANATDPAYRQRFQREARAIETLSHPHVVPLYAAGNSEGIAYLAMKLIDGVTLADVVASLRSSRTTGIPPAGDQSQVDSLPSRSTLAAASECFSRAQRDQDCFHAIARLLADAADALHAAHQSGVIHRDVKPSNLLLDNSGKLWLTDFGLASLGDEQTAVTCTGDVLGTPTYMSPEQTLGKPDQLDHRTDVYSLGATLYELVALERPFNGPRYRIIRDVAQGLLVAPSRLRDDVPRPLEAIILKAMSLQPANRYQSARDFAEDLRRFADGGEVEARLPGLADRILRWGAANPRTTLASVVGVLATVISVIVAQYLFSNRLAEINSQLQGVNLELESAVDQLSRTNAELRDSRSEIENHLYVADMSAAYRAYRSNDVDAARQLVSRHVPVGEAADLRRFEWYLLDNLTLPSQVEHFAGHSSAACAVALLKDNRQLLSVGHDATVRRWEMETGIELGRFSLDANLDAIAVSPDGSTFVTGQNVPEGLNPVAIRDTSSGQVLQELTSHEFSIESAAFSPDGGLIATAGRYQDVLVHSKQGELMARLTTGSRNESLSFSPDGRFLLAVCRKNNDGLSHQFLRAWHVESFEKAFDRDWAFDVFTFAFSANGERILLANGGLVSLHEWPSFEKITCYEELRGRVRAVALSADGEAIAAGCDNGLLFFWDINASTYASTRPADRLAAPRAIDTGGHRINSVEFSASNQVIVATQSGSIQIYRLSEPNPQMVPGPCARAIASFGQHPSRLVLLDQAGIVYLFDTGAGSDRLGKSTDLEPFKEIARLKTNDDGLLAIAPDEKTIVVNASEGLIVLDVESGDILTKFSVEVPVEVPERACLDIKFSVDGRRLFVLLTDQLVQYDTAEWSIRGRLVFDHDYGRKLAVHPSAPFVTVVAGSELLLIELNDWKIVKRHSQGFGALCHANYSPDGRLLTVGHEDGTVELLRSEDFQLQYVLRGHRSDIAESLFINQGRTLVTSSYDETIRFWDLATGRELGVLASPIGATHAMHFSEPLQSLFTFSPSRPTQIWTSMSSPE